MSLRSLASVLLLGTDAAKEISQILTNLIDSSSNSFQSINNNVIPTFLEKIEDVVLNSFIQDARDQTIVTPDIDITIKKSFKTCADGSNFFTLTLLDSSMEVPCEFGRGEKDGAILIAYKGLEMVSNGTSLVDSKENVLINSQVVTGALTHDQKVTDEHPVSFHLKNLQDLAPSYHSVCAYWVPDMGWCSEDCETKTLNDTHTTCTCTHLSSFAVLMAPVPVKSDTVLELLSIIGLVISLISLALSLLTFLLIRSLRSVHTSILNALMACLFLAQMLLLLGITHKWNNIMCAIIAGCLHFLFLCAFSWMALESILLFLTVRNLQAMNYLTSRRSHFPSLCIIGFGIPGLIVSITAGLRSDGYTNEEYCWLNRNIIWSFLGPVCMFIVVNTVLLIFTIWLLQAKLASLNMNVSSLKDTRLLTFKSLAQLFILGPTWIIGIFQFGPGAQVMSYIFTVCNSLQGAFIFLVHCLLNRQVREEYRKLYHKFCSCKKQGPDVSTDTFPMTSKPTTSNIYISRPELRESNLASRADW
ncbi:adhesion G -coupled receptor E3-like [Pelobates cultripes]|uniref:Adhesion G -coupled receptor E3-like n=1 Tax=Pelobates cultripes TaxID=61616 RepID=A0AAD1VXZ3_PELCU|nr:adhesion G -coupled receptor E3-like [Pelobates cultripes]